ncbi:DUF2303 family protein [Zhihengliuella flava]|uniref:Uncharacterized protein YfdQ (DUF2303 family) n=1 Tax=Zhihengliuella flava TaxID=1285193 RepID=A0A931GDS3_9MICC|nr:DUF2303 family protein [Zhihengliuella flava]MBG6083270.1 uncharacterized protein YfdQ (DUF2303 family) [Zhihengliuella flava]
MTNTNSSTETGAYADLAQAAVFPKELEAGKIYAFSDHERGIFTVDTDQYSARPRRQETNHRVSNVVSFIAYLEKWGRRGETEIFARPADGTIEAIIDAGHTRDGRTDDKIAPGRGAHGVILDLKQTKELRAWKTFDGRLNGQEEFAEFIEDQAATIINPSSADMLELAQSLQVAKSVDFKSGSRLADGNTTFQYVETQAARAGQSGNLEIPSELQLAITPYEGGEPYKVTARFRYRLRESRLLLGFKLDRIDKVIEAAFNDIAEQVEEFADENVLLFLRK